MRLTSDFFVSAYIRRCGIEGAFAALRRRGGAEAGAIFIVIDRLTNATVGAGMVHFALRRSQNVQWQPVQVWPQLWPWQCHF